MGSPQRIDVSLAQAKRWFAPQGLQWPQDTRLADGLILIAASAIENADRDRVRQLTRIVEVTEVTAGEEAVTATLSYPLDDDERNQSGAKLAAARSEAMRFLAPSHQVGVTPLRAEWYSPLFMAVQTATATPRSVELTLAAPMTAVSRKFEALDAMAATR